MKNTLSKAEIQLENMKMWLAEQIERYKSLADRNRGFPVVESNYNIRIIAYSEVLARLTEDEK
jgi:hypothetical protein